MENNHADKIKTCAANPILAFEYICMANAMIENVNKSEQNFATVPEYSEYLEERILQTIIDNAQQIQEQIKKAKGMGR